ncbi:hypothetical protein BJ322DRAFT_309504 [Thelephora terrestris]|uniref:Uncharacterized protein n=1 Tax=Thelephora terrestris TaxID=56493 RepID=A0A9P6H7E3_9AGAM|nr:hypothetical protein BJ322DRAFT_309504 [Thelephora terrestris]
MGGNGQGSVNPYYQVEYWVSNNGSSNIHPPDDLVPPWITHITERCGLRHVTTTTVWRTAIYRASLCRVTLRNHCTRSLCWIPGAKPCEPPPPPNAPPLPGSRIFVKRLRCCSSSPHVAITFCEFSPTSVTFIHFLTTTCQGSTVPAPQTCVMFLLSKSTFYWRSFSFRRCAVRHVLTCSEARAPRSCSIQRGTVSPGVLLFYLLLPVHGGWYIFCPVQDVDQLLDCLTYSLF